MTKKERVKARKTYDERNNELMESLWKEELERIPRWNRKENDGFTTIPRWLPIINRIMDKLSQGNPLNVIENLENITEYSSLSKSIKEIISQYKINLQERMFEVGA